MQVCVRSCACLVSFNLPPRKLRCLCLQNVLRTCPSLTNSIPSRRPQPPSPFTWLITLGSERGSLMCPCLPLVYFQHCRLNDVFDAGASWGQKAPRSPSSHQKWNPKSALWSTESSPSTLIQIYQEPFLTSSRKNFCLRAFALPEPLPPRCP